MSKYTVEYFIKKFEKIPDSKWTTGSFEDSTGKRCALGHCGYRIWRGGNKESNALIEILLPIGTVPFINDAIKIEGEICYRDLGDTPKERILNALLLANATQSKEAWWVK